MSADWFPDEYVPISLRPASQGAQYIYGYQSTTGSLNQIGGSFHQLWDALEVVPEFNFAHAAVIARCDIDPPAVLYDWRYGKWVRRSDGIMKACV